MKSGLRPVRLDHRDFDFHKTFGAVEPAQLPDDYSVEANIWNPNQEEANTLYGFTIPPMPEGCTDFASADICIDEDHVFHNPMEVENITHANANGGGDIRTALKVAAQLWNKGAYYSINASGALDMFDAIRLALLSTSSENRGASVGTPFFPEWLNPGTAAILPMPANLKPTVWHNWSVKGWKTIDGVPYLICKVWLGPTWANSGFGLMSREVANTVFGINGSAAFTLGQKVGKPQTVDINIVNLIVSYIYSLYDNFKGVFR